MLPTSAQTEEEVCSIERSDPKVGVGQILKLYLEYFSTYKHFSKLSTQNLSMGLNDKVWPDLDLGRRLNWGRGVSYWKV